jgi:mannose/fructose/N-acetylgalactosamine-specific phosphotransferase system component IIC
MKIFLEKITARIIFNLPMICLILGFILIIMAASKSDYYIENGLLEPPQVLWWSAIGVCVLGIGVCFLLVKNAIRKEIKNAGRNKNKS